MANIKSAKKRAKQEEKRRLTNVARRSEIKTKTKELLDALKGGKEPATLKALLRGVEAKIARAKNKGVFHANASARKISRLAKRVAAATATTAPEVA